MSGPALQHQMKISLEIGRFKQQLKFYADPKRAVGEKKYLKSPWKFYGATAVPMFDEGMHWSKSERFFIRKAIGWALREIANVEPEVAFEFIKRYKHKMSGLTFREASRNLPENYQKLLI